MSGAQLGRASLDLTADIDDFRRNVRAAKGDGDALERVLDGVAAMAELAERNLNQVRMGPGQAAESKASAESILSGVRGISEESRVAAAELDRVRLTDRQAAESVVAGERIKRNINDIGDEADRTKRKLAEVKLAGGPTGRSGVGVGAFGSGYGRIGLLGAAVGAGALTAPAVAPATVGLLAAIPALAGAGAGALGTLALAFDGVGKAIGGDYEAFQALQPAQQEFVQDVRGLDGWLNTLKETAGENLFPGLDKALHEALSPGTVNAVTTAIAGMAQAIGQAGEQWGRYFGSSGFQQTFGPLMKEGARAIGELSDAALHLFDALGTLAKAAIPLTDWMMRGIDEGAKLADSWLHAKTATGELGRAMDEAKTSLDLVGRLVGSLLNAVGALGAALYPVSKIAVKDLTDGLNALARIIGDNQGAIREIANVGVEGLVGAFRAGADAVTAVDHALKAIIGDKADFVTAALAIGGAITLFMGPKSAAITGAILAIGLIRQHWQQVSDWVLIAADKLALAVVEPFSHLPGALGGWARKAKEQVEAELESDQQDLAAIGTANGNAYGQAMVAAAAKALAQMPALDQRTIRAAGKMPSYTPSSYGPSYIPGSSALKDMAAAAARKFGVPVNQFLAQINQESGFNPTAVSSAGAAGIAQFMPGTAAGFHINPYNPSEALPAAAKMMAGLYKKYGSWSLALAAYNAGSQRVDDYLAGKTSGLPSETTAYVASILGKSASLPAPTGAYAAPTSSSVFGTPPPFTTNVPTVPKPKTPKVPTVVSGENLLPEALRDALQKAQDMAVKSQGVVARRWLQTELDDLEKARASLMDQLGDAKTAKQRAAIKDEIRSIDGEMAGVHKQITDNLHQQAEALRQQAEQIRSAYSTRISTAVDAVSSAMAGIKQALDQQFERQTQQFIDETLAPQYYQGVDPLTGAPRQTPMETLLSAMQMEDTKQGLQDSIDQAQKQLDLDRQTAGVTQDQLDADQRALDQAQRAYQENELQIDATQERQKADADYADAVKKYQDQRTTAEQAMNTALDKITTGLLNGTTTVDALNVVAGKFGVSLTDGGGGIADDMSGLQTAVQTLAAVMVAEAAALARAGATSSSGGNAAEAAVLSPGVTIPSLIGKIPKPVAGGAVAMADGGYGIADRPMLFLAGEAGPEPYAFGGAGRTMADLARGLTGGAGSGTIELVVNLDGRELARSSKPYQGRIVTVGK